MQKGLSIDYPPLRSRFSAARNLCFTLSLLLICAGCGPMPVPDQAINAEVEIKPVKTSMQPERQPIDQSRQSLPVTKNPGAIRVAKSETPTSTPTTPIVRNTKTTKVAAAPVQRSELEKPETHPALENYNKAKQFLDHSRYYQAIKLLEQHPDHNPSQALLLVAYEKLILTLLKNKQIREAENTFSRAIIIDPSSKSLAAINKKIKRIKLAQQQTKTRPSPSDIKPQQKPLTLDARTQQQLENLLQTAELAYAKRDFKSAKNAWNQALKLQPSNQSAKKGLQKTKLFQEKLKAF